MHTLRHTYAMRCIEAGMCPKTLQMLLGHSNINITMNLYVYVTDDEKKKEVKDFEIKDIGESAFRGKIRQQYGYVLW